MKSKNLINAINYNRQRGMEESDYDEYIEAIEQANQSHSLSPLKGLIEGYDSYEEFLEMSTNGTVVCRKFIVNEDEDRPEILLSDGSCLHEFRGYGFHHASNFIDYTERGSYYFHLKGFINEAFTPLYKQLLTATLMTLCSDLTAKDTKFVVEEAVTSYASYKRKYKLKDLFMPNFSLSLEEFTEVVFSGRFSGSNSILVFDKKGIHIGDKVIPIKWMDLIINEKACGGKILDTLLYIYTEDTSISVHDKAEVIEDILQSYYFSAIDLENAGLVKSEAEGEFIITKYWKELLGEN